MVIRRRREEQWRRCWRRRHVATLLLITVLARHDGDGDVRATHCVITFILLLCENTKRNNITSLPAWHGQHAGYRYEYGMKDDEMAGVVVVTHTASLLLTLAVNMANTLYVNIIVNSEKTMNEYVTVNEWNDTLMFTRRLFDMVTFGTSTLMRALYDIATMTRHRHHTYYVGSLSRTRHVYDTIDQYQVIKCSLGNIVTLPLINVVGGAGHAICRGVGGAIDYVIHG